MSESQRPAGAGYSGRPLSQKLGFKPGQRVFVLDAPADYVALAGIDPASVTLLRRAGDFDLAHAFVRDRAALSAALDRLEPHVTGAAVLWISWPKKTSTLFRDLTEDGVRELALPRGLVDVKVCAVDADWSGLKLVRRKALR